LNWNGENGHFYLAPDFNRNGFSHSSFSILLAICLSYIAFIMLTNISSIPSIFRIFIMKSCLIFCICWEDYAAFVLAFVYML
jgi:hypothetical protein